MDNTFDTDGNFDYSDELDLIDFEEECPILGALGEYSEPVLGAARENVIITPDVTLSNDDFTTMYEITKLPEEIRFNIQKTYVGDKYIYFLQNENESVKSHISRIPYKSNVKRYDASKAETIVLNDFGHSQTLEYFEYNGGSYFWTGCGGTTVSSGHRWSKSIGLIKFNTNTNVINTANVKRLQKLECANKKGTSYGKLLRVEAALSPNRKNLLIMARCKYKEPDDIVTSFAIYDANKLASLLFNKKSIFIINCDSTQVIEACISSFVSKDIGSGPVLYTMSRCSNTGLELDDYGNIYYSSDSKDKAGDKKRNGKFIIKVNSTGKSPKVIFFEGAKKTNNYNSEMEGLQLTNSQLYFTDIYCDTTLNKDITGIKRIDYKI